MVSFAEALRAEIRRLAATEAQRSRLTVSRLERQLRALRALARDSARSVARLERQVRRLELQARRVVQARPQVATRMAPETIRALRGKQSRKAFARRLGVSPGSIFGWETGRTIPRGRNVASLEGLQKKLAQAKRAARGGGR